MQTLTDVLSALFFALGSAWFVVDLARKLRASDAAPRPAPETAVPAAPPPAAASAPAIPADVSRAPADTAPGAAPGDTPPPHLAVIAAVVHHLFQGRARIASVAPAGHGGHALAVDWAREGRRDIFTSHRVR